MQVGATLEELQTLGGILFQGLNIRQKWTAVFRSAKEAPPLVAFRNRAGANAPYSSSTQRPSPPPSPPIPPASPPTRSSQQQNGWATLARASQAAGKFQDAGRAHIAPTPTISFQFALLHALYATWKGLTAFERYRFYIEQNAMDFVPRIFCILSLIGAVRYEADDFAKSTISVLDREAILSYTVILLWIKQVHILQITSATGTFVYMIGRMTMVRRRLVP
eukprot:2071878-Prymnesium_polylepis.3